MRAIVWGLASSFIVYTVSSALSADLGGLPRKGGLPLENIAEVETEYGSLLMLEGYRVRTLVTRPTGTKGRLSAILYVQWLSCDTIETSPDKNDGWSQILRSLAQTPGFIFMRTDKPGVGDSGGPACETLDYQTEVDMHRRAYDQLASRPDVDPDHIYIVGMSMGTTMAPLVAQGRKVAGIAVWGGGGRTWLERQLGFERRALELGGVDPVTLKERMEKLTAFYLHNLVDKKTPAEIAASYPELADVWGNMVGADTKTHMGRTYAFHQQAEAQDWAGAWAKLDVPVLVLYGEYDWYENEESAQAIVTFVNWQGPRSAELVVIAGTDHHFDYYPSRQDAFTNTDGKVNAGPAINHLRKFLTANRRQ